MLDDTEENDGTVGIMVVRGQKAIDKYLSYRDAKDKSPVKLDEVMKLGDVYLGMLEECDEFGFISGVISTARLLNEPILIASDGLGDFIASECNSDLHDLIKLSSE